MYEKQKTGWMYLILMMGSSLMPILCYPSIEEHSHIQPHIILPEGRKFAEKPNPIKKATMMVVEDRNDLDDVQMDSIPVRKNQDSSFSWGNVLTTVMQMLFSPPAGAGPSKSDSIDTGQNMSQSPWTNLFSVGLRLLTVFLGGGQMGGNDGIDKVDNASPYQGVLSTVLSAFLGTANENQVAKVTQLTGEFIGTIVQLMETLKQSFSHRSSNARSLGKKDSISEAAVAGITFFKNYLRSMRTNDDDCTERIICEANKECAEGLHDSNAIFCQMGTYATSTLLLKTSSVPYESLREAGRRGRNGRNTDDCKRFYSTCTEKI